MEKSEYWKQWYEKNKERRKAQSRLYYANNKHKVRVYSKKYHLLNRDKIIARVNKWQEENRERFMARIKINTHKRRAVLKNCKGSYTAYEVQQKLRRQKFKCKGCKTDIKASYHIDHIMPLARGGENNIGNIQLLCRTCNLSKGAKHPKEWAKTLS